MEQVRIKLIREKDLNSKEVTTLDDAVSFIGDLIKDADREMLIEVNLDSRKKPTNYTIVSMGSLSSSIVHAREVFKAAILSNADSIMLFHNHPTGIAAPSMSDAVTTMKLIEAGELLGIPLIDHIIVGTNGCYSFKDKGLIDDEQALQSLQTSKEVEHGLFTR